MTICIVQKTKDKIIIGTDSQTTENSVPIYGAKKYRKYKWGHVVSAGCVWTMNIFFNKFILKTIPKNEEEFKNSIYTSLEEISKYEKELGRKLGNFEMIFIFKDKIYFLNKIDFGVEEVRDYICIGSPRELASFLMKKGLCIKDVILECISNDIYCGGEIFYKEIKLKTKNIE